MSQGVAEGLKINNVAPRYPREAREKHIQGDVLLGFIIDRQGKAAKIELIKGDPILAEAAIDAVKQWTYKPYLLKGEPVEVDTTAKITFFIK